MLQGKPNCLILIKNQLMNYIKLLRIQGKGNGYLKEASHNMIERKM